MQPYLHLSDLRTALLLRGRTSVAGDATVSKAEACVAAMAQAGRLLAERRDPAHLSNLLAQAGVLLDGLDEYLLVLAHDEDRAVFAQLELMRATLNDLESRRARMIMT